MRIAYCPVCKEVIAAGELPVTATVAGKEVDCTPIHKVKGEAHRAKVVEVKSTKPIEFGESPEKYLKRLSEEYNKSLNS